MAAALTVLVPASPAAAGATESWTQLSPTTSPATRTAAGMAYDAASSQMILFGGQTSTFVGDTWNWTGTNWVQLSPATSPSARSEFGMAYDAALGKIVLFGGATGSSSVANDTWTWNGTTWAQLSPSGTIPSARAGMAMDYDPTLGKIVLFGGSNSPAGSTYYNDTYTFDGTTWTQLSSGTTGTPPPTRFGASFAYDTATSSSLLYSGANSSTQQDAWSFTSSNSKWSQQTGSTATDADTHSFSISAYDPTNQQVVLVVGHEANTEATWLWGGTGWVLGPTTGPASRDKAAMAWDPRNNQLILFGGEDINFNRLGDTWAYGAPTPTLTTSSSLSWPTTTLNGYDQHLTASQTVSVPTPGGSNWNISVSANTQLTTGTNNLPAVTVNGSSVSYTASTAPGQTCTGSGCSTSTPTGGVSYPVTVPVSSNALLFSAQANTGSGTQNIIFGLWATVPATAKPGSYANTLTESVNYGP